MVLSVKSKKGYIPLKNRTNFNIVYSYEGEQMLSFDLAVNDKAFSELKERSKLKYLDNRYNVTRINKRKSIVTIQADLDLNEWKREIHRTFKIENALFSDVLLQIKPDGWTMDDIEEAKGRFDIELTGVNAYDILMECKKIYGIVFEYHIVDKRIKVIDPLVIQQRGLFLSEELNLDSVEYKGEYGVQVNRLYAYGKKIETEDENGNKHIEYVNFAGINHGLEYIDCMDYIDDEIICAYWQDDKIIDPQELLRKAKEQLKELAFPKQSWGCNIYDLSRTNKKYQCLDFKLYDKPVLLTDGLSIVHQIVEYSEYPDQQQLNKVVLSTSFKKIQGEIKRIKSDLNDLDLDLKVKENLLNEIKRSVDSNTLRIENTYSKEEVDTKQESIIQQTNDYIDLSIAQVDKKIEQLDMTTIQFLLMKDGSLLDETIDKVELHANVLKNNEDITNDIAAISFNWERKSKDSEADYLWNISHKAMKEVTLTKDDVHISASFRCILSTAQFTKYTGFETITNESDIPKLTVYLDSNLPLYQHYNLESETLVPAWNPLIITPEVKDGLLQIPLNQCVVNWKRFDGELIDGEVIENGVLKVSQNKLLDEEAKSITYICTVTYKEYTAFASKGFILLSDGSAGKGVDEIVVEYFLSTSKETQIGGEWSPIPPSWIPQHYMWTRNKIIYSDATVSYSQPTCDSSWQVITGLEIGGRNLLLNSSFIMHDRNWESDILEYVNKNKKRCAHISSVELNTTKHVVQSILGKLEPSSTYTMSGWVLLENIQKGDTAFYLGIRHQGMYKVLEEELSFSFGDCKFATEGKEGQWQFVTCTFMSDTNKVLNEVVSDIEILCKDCIGDIYFYNFKLEKGNFATDWTPAIEDINEKIEDDVNQVESRVTQSFQSAIEQSKSEINLSVEELITTTTETREQINGIQNQIQLTNEQTSFIKTTVDTLNDVVNGKVDESKIQEWARFDGSSLELGQSNSPFKAILTNTELGFWQGDTKVAWISNNELHVTKSVIVQQIQVGNWLFRDEGSAGFTLRRL
ncbi:phage tail protein [Amedibacillus sp. YH-ame10]